MSFHFNQIHREAAIDRMLDDGTFEQQKAEAFDRIMDDKERKAWINDCLMTKLVEDYDLSHAVRKFDDEKKLAVFNCLLDFIKDVLDEECEDLAHTEIETMAEDSY